MTRRDELDALVRASDLNLHPFYLAWAAGTLPREALCDYAADYGRFVATIADGWEALGEPEIAETEREHERLWADFRAGLGAEDRTPNAQTRALVDAASEAFAAPDSALGGLYAFESQQPRTSASKLKGLEAHYDLPAAGKRYFEVHANDFDEPELLAGKLDAMDETQFRAARAACERLCRAMWRALDGLYPAAALA